MNEDFTKAEMAEPASRNVDPKRDAVAKADSYRHPEAEPKPNGNESLSSPSFLMSFARWHPAVGAYQWLADCHYPVKTMAAHERFQKFRDKHNWLFWVAVVIDMLVMLVVLVGLGLVAARVIYITLFA